MSTINAHDTLDTRDLMNKLNTLQQHYRPKCSWCLTIDLWVFPIRGTRAHVHEELSCRLWNAHTNQHLYFAHPGEFVRFYNWLISGLGHITKEAQV